jgi:CRP-like cAMP-binding protein
MKRKVWLFIGFLLLGMALAFAVTKFPKDWFKPDYLVDISSILTLISFSVRSMLTLRILAIGAQLTFIPYCFLQSTPLWTPIVWNVLFLSVNVYNVIVILLQKRPVVLSDDEQHIYNLAFKSFTPREFLKLAAIGEWKDGGAGDVILPQGQAHPYLAMLSRGQAVSFHDDRDLATIPEGKFLGLAEALEGTPPLLGIKLSADSRYLFWAMDVLQQFAAKEPQMEEKLRLVFLQDLEKTIRDLEEIEFEDGHKTQEAVQSAQEKADRAVGRMVSAPGSDTPVLAAAGTKHLGGN